MIISKFPKGGRGDGGDASSAIPIFTYSGEYTIVSDDEDNWVIRLTSSGTLVLENSVSVVIQAQGGGGAGGAGYASGSGSDGEDGDIASKEVTLEPGEYIISIGAAGAKNNNAAGGVGGDTSFGDLLAANGGAGGAHKGGESLEHSGLYDTYGQGGEGGTTSDYTGSYTPGYYHAVAGASGMKLYKSDDINSEVIAEYKAGYVLLMGLSYPTTYVGDGGNFYYRESGTRGYILTSEVSDISYSHPVDNRVFYGHAGNPGIVLISRKVEA